MADVRSAIRELESSRRLPVYVVLLPTGVIIAVLWILISTGYASYFLGLRHWRVPGTSAEFSDPEWHCAVEKDGPVLRIYAADASASYVVGSFNSILARLPESAEGQELFELLLLAHHDNEKPIAMIDLPAGSGDDPLLLAVMHDLEVAAIVDPSARTDDRAPVMLLFERIQAVD